MKIRQLLRADQIGWFLLVLVVIWVGLCVRSITTQGDVQAVWALAAAACVPFLFIAVLTWLERGRDNR